MLLHGWAYDTGSFSWNNWTRLLHITQSRVADTATKIRFMYSQKKNCASSVPFSTFMCLWAIIIFPESVLIFYCSRIGRPILGMYTCKSPTDTWMWKLGLMTSNSFSGNISLNMFKHQTRIKLRHKNGTKYRRLPFWC